MLSLVMLHAGLSGDMRLYAGNGTAQEAAVEDRLQASSTDPAGSLLGGEVSSLAPPLSNAGYGTDRKEVNSTCLTDYRYSNSAMQQLNQI